MIQIAKQNRYPEFIPNQILTNTQLNQLHQYLDEQNRLTRTSLTGMGIICGLHARLEEQGGSKKILLTKGFGISSDGHIITLPQPFDPNAYNFSGATPPLVAVSNLNIEEIEFTRIREYNDPYLTGDGDELRPRYEPWQIETQDCNQTSSELTTQIKIWELLTEDQLKGIIGPIYDELSEQELKDEKDKIASELGDDIEDKIVVLYLETFPKNLKSCLTTDCTQNGLDKLLTVRALVIDKDCLQGVTPCEGLGKLIQIPRLHHGLEQTGSKLDTLDDNVDLKKAYKDMGDYIRTELITLLENSVPVYQGLLNTHDLPTEKSELKAIFEEIEEVDFTQYHFGFYKDLATAYNEFTLHICTLVKDCCMEGNFPRHLMLGFVDAENESYRHRFMPSPIRNVMREDLQKAERLLRRIFALAGNFNLPTPKIEEPEIKITPSQTEKHLLGERAIPYYYNLSEVKDLWQPKDCCSPPVLSYESNDMDEPSDVDYSSLLINPLLADLHEHSFFRIEGHYGASCDEVLNKLNELKNLHNLPFDVRTVQFGLNTALMEEERVLESTINGLLDTITERWDGWYKDAILGPIDPDFQVIIEAQEGIQSAIKGWQQLQTQKPLLCDISSLQTDYLKLRAELLYKLRQIRPLLGELPEIYEETRERIITCLDSKDLPVGKRFGNDENMPGDIIFTSNGITASVERFYERGNQEWSFNSAFILERNGAVRIDTAEINLKFDFSNLEYSVEEVHIEITDSGELGNIAANGSQIIPGVIPNEIPNIIAPGVEFSFIPDNTQEKGIIILTGNINNVTIGSRKLFIHSVCAIGYRTTHTLSTESTFDPQIHIRSLRLKSLTNLIPKVLPKDICQANFPLLTSLYQDVIDTAIQIKLIYCLVFSEGNKSVSAYSNFPKWDDLLYTLNQLHYNSFLPRFTSLFYILKPLKSPRFKDLVHLMNGIEHQAGVSCGGTFVVVCEDIQDSDVEGMEVVADFTLCKDKCCCEIDLAATCLPPVAMTDYEIIEITMINGEPDPNQWPVEIPISLNDFNLETSQDLEFTIKEESSKLGAKLELLIEETEIGEKEAKINYGFKDSLPPINQIDYFQYTVTSTFTLPNGDICTQETIGHTWVLLKAVNDTESETANVQLIHNSATPTIDIYINGELTITDFAFRTATPFIEIPAATALEIGIAPGNSTGDIIATFPISGLAADGNYVIVVNGLIGDADTPLNLVINDMGQQAGTGNSIDFTVFHGSPDMPAVDVIARGVETLVNDATFGDFTKYLSVPATSYSIDITPARDNRTIIATFVADLSNLAGGAAVVFASGFLAPEEEQPPFGLFAALPDGTVIEFPSSGIARLQVIHNSPTPTVDVYVDETLLIDNFAFRSATPFIDAPAGEEIIIGIALDNSDSSSDVIATFSIFLENGGTYVAVANGIVGDADTPFGLVINAMGQEAGTDDNVDFAVLHGSPDAPAVDVIARGVGTLVDSAAFGDFTGYLSVPADSYLLDITPAEDNGTIVATFEADLTGLAGGAAVVFASGFLSGDEPDFGLFAALPDGTVFEFPYINPNPGGIRVIGIPLRGRVVFANGNVAVGATVLVESTNIGTFTDANGRFSITNLEDGDYTLIISLVGFLSQRIQIRVKSNSSENLGNIILTSLRRFTGVGRILGEVGSSVPKLPGAENLYILGSAVSQTLSINANDAFKRVGSTFAQRHLDRINVLSESKEKAEINTNPVLNTTEAFITETLVNSELSNVALAKSYEKLAGLILKDANQVETKKEKDALKNLLEITTHAYMDRKALDNESELDEATVNALKNIADQTRQSEISVKGIRDRWKGNALDKDLKIPLANDLKNSFK